MVVDDIVTARCIRKKRTIQFEEKEKVGQFHSARQSLATQGLRGGGCSLEVRMDFSIFYSGN